MELHVRFYKRFLRDIFGIVAVAYQMFAVNDKANMVAHHQFFIPVTAVYNRGNDVFFLLFHTRYTIVRAKSSLRLYF